MKKFLTFFHRALYFWLSRDLPHEEGKNLKRTLTTEYTMREDIVLALEEYDLSDKQCKALLKSPCPLSDVFKDFEKRETDHMENIRDTIECRANAVIRQDFVRELQEAR